jgi:hypothetical protein
VVNMVKAYSSCVEEMVNYLKGYFGNRLKSVVLRGSVVKNTIVPGWSDIDALAVVDSVGFEDQRQLKTFLKEITARYGFKKVGCDLIRYDERPSVTRELYTQGDKTFSLLQEMKEGMYKVLHGEDIFSGCWENVSSSYATRDYIRRVQYLVGKKRKDAGNEDIRTNLFLNVRTAFGMVKDALKMKGILPITYSDTADSAISIFTGMDCTPLYRFDSIRYRFDVLSEEEVTLLLKESDKFIEDFGQYFLHDVTNVKKELPNMALMLSGLSECGKTSAGKYLDSIGVKRLKFDKIASQKAIIDFLYNDIPSLNSNNVVQDLLYSEGYRLGETFADSLTTIANKDNIAFCSVDSLTNPDVLSSIRDRMSDRTRLLFIDASEEARALRLGETNKISFRDALAEIRRRDKMVVKERVNEIKNMADIVISNEGSVDGLYNSLKDAARLYCHDLNST